MRTITALLFALMSPLLVAQSSDTPLIKEEFDRFRQETVLSYVPDLPPGSPWTQLKHVVGRKDVFLLYTHLKPTIQFRGACTTEGLADGKPFSFPAPGESDVSAMRQGFVETVSWVIPLELLRTFADSTNVEIRHCGRELYIQPGITMGAAQMLQAIERGQSTPD